MTSNNSLARPRIIGSVAHKFIGRNVTVVGEVVSITPHANTVTLRMPDDENIYVLLQRNSNTIEPNLLTEVSGKLVSRGSIEAFQVKQWTAKETAAFNRVLYTEAVLMYDAFRLHYDL